MIWLTVIVFVGLLLALVLVHEWGHFAAARLAGCRVDEFAFGFPPRLWSVQRGETRYAFNLLPLGGYVKIEGEDMNEAAPGPRSFASKTAPWQIFILSAGVMMNVGLAVVFLSAQAYLGSPVLVSDENRHQVADLQTFIVEVDPASPAAAAGVEPLDRLVHIEGVREPAIEQVQALTREKAGSEVTLEVERQGRHYTFTLSPRVDPPPGEGAIGVALQATGLEKFPWWRSPIEGVKRTWLMLEAIFTQFGHIVSQLVAGQATGDALTGPVGIAVYTNEVTQLGVSYILEFGALISLNLAIINILPIPALDGGRIMFVLLGSLLGRRIPGKIEQYSHLTGFALLILLMIFITFKDVQQYF